MSTNLVTETLLAKRNELVAERDQVVNRLNHEISQIEAALERETGKKVWEVEPTVYYDDENPNYIRASIEEI